MASGGGVSFSYVVGLRINVQRFTLIAREDRLREESCLGIGITYLIVYALVEKDTQRPPIRTDIIALTRIYLGCEVGERP